jgi:di/tricarboxylate transporter
MFGDELLILAPRQGIERLRNQSDFVVLQEFDVPVLRPYRALAALAIVAAVVTAAALGLLPIAESALVGSVLMVVTRCLPLRKVYESIDWKIVFLLACLIPMGTALEQSGAADLVVGVLLSGVHGWWPTIVLGALFLLAALLTGVLSNNATALLLAPIAVSTAHAMGVDPRPFLVAVTFAASSAFYTPIGYQTNLLVYGPGGYRFLDYVRVGGPLNALIWIVATLLIPRFFPF